MDTEISEATEKILGEIAEAYDMEIDTLEVMEDHVHLFVSSPHATHPPG